MTYGDFEFILVPKDNGKQNPNKSYTNKCEKVVAGSFVYKLVCGDYKISKPFNSHLGEDAVYNFINSMLEENKYFNDEVVKHFNKEIVMTKDIMKILRTLLNVGFVTMSMMMMMLK